MFMGKLVGQLVSKLVSKMVNKQFEQQASDSPLPSPLRRPVFIISAGLILLFSLFGAGFSAIAEASFGGMQSWLVANMGWFYLLVTVFFFFFVLYLALSNFGKIRLGPDDSRPDFSYVSWFAMLFSAGMGIGLMFFSVAEPLTHYVTPPLEVAGSTEAARQAMLITFLHWGLQAWAVYIVMGLSLAYFSFRRGLPLTIRSTLYPIIGERIKGPIGHAVDIFAVLGTLFGIATSLGLGVMQVNAGLNYLFDVPVSVEIQIALIAAITLLATLSVVAGLNAGIRRLSMLNFYLAALLLAFVFVMGPTTTLIVSLFQNIGSYVVNFLPLNVSLYKDASNDWMGAWTLFYWAWWISWSPFVGMFIARISRGRTIREFVFGVLLLPTGFTFMWLTFFGNSALVLELAGQGGNIVDAVQNDMPTALFVMLEQLPWASITSLIATVLVVTFFVTSSDSGSLVIDIITSNGDLNLPVWQRVFWATTEGVVAAVLLAAGGLTALQTAAIGSALPLAIILLFICYGLHRGLKTDSSFSLSGMRGSARSHP